ncbi:hypothetical protein LTR56_017850 [Elasticomyces elasticus]|nr:hypothetical protein LTR22_023618 [Elasticomyces elasticus]KAK3629731.1 hypothetical protein LTR56_017850 [Elasticomyces elasticus]KAK4906477.1 hypothetical protein LTR49_024366 [Elasticomyces elasticus]KAK5747275.1 hypothetical protein LTS12_022455 [Elasticomyces elasticus]
MAAVAKCALGFAQYQALPIAWWYRLSRGNTIKELERQWEAGHSLSLALRHNVRMGFAGFATLLVALQIIDGPLFVTLHVVQHTSTSADFAPRLQKATSIGIATQTASVTLALNLVQEVPTGFSGISIDAGVSQSGRSTKVLADRRNKVPITLDVQQCNDTCTVMVRAPGVSRANCTSQTWNISSADYSDPDATWGRWKSYDPERNTYSNPLFLIDLEPYSSDLSQTSEGAVLETGILSFLPTEDGNVTGSFVDTVCTYSPAVLEYDVILKGTEATIPDHPGQGRLVQVANNTLSYNEQVIGPSTPFPNTMDVFTMYLNLYVGLNTSVIISANNSDSVWSMDTKIQSNNAEFAKYVDLQADPALVIANPTHDIISSLNEMMFRAGVLSTGWANVTNLIDGGLPIRQSVEAKRTVVQNVYQSDLRWFAGAAALEILAAVFVLPLFWGWWTLDSTRLMSPIEIALAFDAPLLKDMHSAAGASEVVKKLGDVCVRYGAVQGSRAGHEANDAKSNENDGTSYRLGIAEMRSVVKPYKGLQFNV